MYRFPWLLAFGLGLLHGLGFAGALAEIGLPADEIPLALLSFNLASRQASQLIFCSVLLGGYFMARKLLRLSALRLERRSLHVVLARSPFWFLERVAAVV